MIFDPRVAHHRNSFRKRCQIKKHERNDAFHWTRQVKYFLAKWKHFSEWPARRGASALSLVGTVRCAVPIAQRSAGATVFRPSQGAYACDARFRLDFARRGHRSAMSSSINDSAGRAARQYRLTIPACQGTTGADRIWRSVCASSASLYGLASKAAVPFLRASASTLSPP